MVVAQNHKTIAHLGDLGRHAPGRYRSLPDSLACVEVQSDDARGMLYHRHEVVAPEHRQSKHQRRLGYLPGPRDRKGDRAALGSRFGMGWRGREQNRGRQTKQKERNSTMAQASSHDGSRSKIALAVP